MKIAWISIIILIAAAAHSVIQTMKRWLSVMSWSKCIKSTLITLISSKCLNLVSKWTLSSNNWWGLKWIVASIKRGLMLLLIKDLGLETRRMTTALNALYHHHMTLMILSTILIKTIPPKNLKVPLLHRYSVSIKTRALKIKS